MDLTSFALYGDQPNTSAIPAGMLTTNAAGETDWNSVLANGIRGAAQAAMSASVGEKFASGQLVSNTAAVAQSNRTRNMLIAAAVIYFVLKS